MFLSGAMAVSPRGAAPELGRCAARQGQGALVGLCPLFHCVRVFLLLLLNEHDDSVEKRL